MKNSKNRRKRPESRVGSGSGRSQTPTSTVKRRGQTKTRSRDRTAYAACWCDDYDCDFGVYKVFSSRGKCLDCLTDMVFERAKLLEVGVVDQYARPVRDDVGDLVFPKMTREQVRDRLGSGMDFCLVLKTSPQFDDLFVDEQASMGIRKVEIE